MKNLIFLLSFVTALNCYAQKLNIKTLEQASIAVTIVDSTTKSKLLTQLKGIQDNSYRKKWTARTFVLSDKQLLVEFYDKQAVLINNVEDFKKLSRVRFVKNNIDFLKKNISYKIDLSLAQGKQLVQKEKAKWLKNFKSDTSEYTDYEVYELATKQIVFLNKSKNEEKATIYPDLKTLSSDQSTIAEQVFNLADEEYLMKRLASGDRLLDYEPSEHLIYPKYAKHLIKNHKLKLVETKIFLSPDFYSNLYQSEKGYYMLIDDFNQLNVARTKRIGIGTIRIYNTIDELRADQKIYKTNKDKGVLSEHMYQKISDVYGQKFPERVNQLIESLPDILNFDKEQLTLNNTGIDVVDEALLWAGTSDQAFNKWFPAVLAYYGQCYINNKKNASWAMYLDKESNVWIPEVKLKDGTAAWNWINFYKSMYEGPIPLRWVGNWDGRFLK